jgi:hypothetical protein
MKYLSRLLVLALFSSLALLTSQAQAGTYTVGDCQPIPVSSAVALTAFSTNSPGKWVNDAGTLVPGTYKCIQQQQNIPYESLTIYANYGSSFSEGDVSRFKWSPSNGLGIKRVTAHYYTGSSIPSDPDFLPRMILHNNGANGLVIPIYNDWINGTIDYTVPNDGSRTDFEINLKCVKTTCHSGSYADKIKIGHIEFTVNDPNLPYAEHSTTTGTLYNPGTVSGLRIVNGTAVDTGSGVWFNWLKVNGGAAALATESSGQPNVSCNPTTPTYNTFRPCPIISNIGWLVDTAEPPFVNGANDVSICTRDYSGNNYCEPSETVYVSN